MEYQPAVELAVQMTVPCPWKIVRVGTKRKFINSVSLLRRFSYILDNLCLLASFAYMEERIQMFIWNEMDHCL